MISHPIFLSIVCLVRNQQDALHALLDKVGSVAGELASDHEIIVIDNASTDGSVEMLRQLTMDDGLPNLQVYALTREVDTDTAFWAGIENALGDYVVVLDPILDEIGVLPDLLDAGMQGADVVFARNLEVVRHPFAYRMASAAFNLLFKWFDGMDLAREAPHYRMLSRALVNHLLQHPQPSVTYRHLPARGGFRTVRLEYSAVPGPAPRRKLGEAIDRGIRLLVSTSRAPLRLVTSLSLFGAIANVLYSVYVVVIGIFKADVAPGWISMSLQQSGMFFLISLVLLVLGEYILQMARMSNEGPLYHVGREFTSARLTRRMRLNVEHRADDAHAGHRDRFTSDAP